MTPNLFQSVKTQLNAKDRSNSFGHQAAVFWLTGLSGAGKSHLAYAVEAKLHQLGKHVYVLDGDNLRTGLNADLDFSAQGRAENIRRVAAVATMMKEAGLIVITSFISPFKTGREQAKALCGPFDFFEIFIDCPLETCEARDVKGLYKKARNGEIPNFTGISSPYEIPENPALILPTEQFDIVHCTNLLLDFILDKTVLDEK